MALGGPPNSIPVCIVDAALHRIAIVDLTLSSSGGRALLMA
jgi:hypothetical protein